MKPIALTLLGILTLCACGEETTTGSGGQQQPVALVVVTPSTATLVSLGESVQLNASAQDGSGNSISGKTFTWSSSDESVATVSVSGLVLAIANGATTITATTDGVQDAASLTVAQEASQIVVTPGAARLVTIGLTIQLAASASDANGNPIPLTWSSSDQNVATVSATGLVSAVAPGSVTVTANAGGVSGSATIDVGTVAYVTNFDAQNVSVIATSTNTVVATVPVGTQPIAVALTPDGAFAYVTNSSGSVSVLSTASNTVVATVPVGSLPFGVAITPDGAFAYVTNRGTNDVSVITTSTNTVVATVPVGSGPGGVAITPDGAFAYVTNSPGSVFVLSTASNTVVATVPVGAGPFGVAITPFP